MAYHIFDYGPTGRHILVDDDGRLIINGDASTSGHIYAYGDTGYPLLVDGTGRLLINPSGLPSGTIPESVQSVSITSGVMESGGIPVNLVAWNEAGYAKYENRFWLGAENSGGDVYSFAPSGDNLIPRFEFTMPSGGKCHVMHVWQGKLWLAESIPTGGGGAHIWSYQSGVLTHETTVPDADGITPTTVKAMHNYNGRLTLIAADNFGSDPPVQSWHPQYGWKIDGRIHVNPGSWGHEYITGVHDGKLIIVQPYNTDKAMNIWDGFITRYYQYSAAEHPTGGPGPFGKEYKGKFYVLSDDVWEVNTTDGVSLAKSFEGYDGRWQNIEIYNGKLYATNIEGIIWRFDGVNWERFGKVPGWTSTGNTNFPRKLVVLGDRMYVLYWYTQMVYSFKEPLSEHIDEATWVEETPVTQKAEYITELASFVGVDVPAFLDISTSGIPSSPVYGSTNIVTQGANLASGVSELDANLGAAMYLKWVDDRNAAFGDGALDNLDPGGGASNNIGIGYNAGNSITTADRNIILGAFAMENVDSVNNCVVLGDYAANLGSGGGSVIIGNEAGRWIPYAGAGNNVGVGNQAMRNANKKLLTNCLAIGANAMEQPTIDLTNATAIGFQATASGNNTMRLGRYDVEVQCEHLMVQRDINSTDWSIGSSGNASFRTYRGSVTIQAATSGTYAIDFSSGAMTRITLDGDITFSFVNAYDGQKHIIQIKQDGTGGHDVTWPASVRWPGGSEPTLTTAASGINYIGFIYDNDDDKYDGTATALDMQ
jgi:hypothetical protein